MNDLIRFLTQEKECDQTKGRVESKQILNATKKTASKAPIKNKTQMPMIQRRAKKGNSK